MATPTPSLTPLIIETPQGVTSNGTLSIDTSVLPYLILTDLNTSQVELSVYNTTYVNQTAVPFPTTANISETSIESNVLSVEVPNNLLPGQEVTFAGTQEAFLNGQTVTVLTANSTSFTANFTYPNYSLAITAVAAAVGSPLTTTYTFSGPGLVPQVLVGLVLTFSGFAQAANNGTFTVISNTANTVTVNNTNGMVDTTGTAISVYSNPADTGTATWTNQNSFSGAIPVNTAITPATVQIIGRNYDPTVAWTANTAYVVGQRYADPNGNVQIVVQAGTSGATQPTWNLTVDGYTNDPTAAGVVWQNLGRIAITPIFKFNLIYFQTSDALVIAPPSGISAYKQLNFCQLEWALPTYEGFIGVRVMVSTDPAGVNPPFTQFGTDTINNVTRVGNVVIASNTVTNVSGNSTVITTTQQTETVNYSSVMIPLTYFNLLPNQTFYAMLSTVIQDPNTQTIYESQQNGPITCGFVNLRLVSPTDFLALQRKEDIAGRLITSMTSIYPSLDLTPRSEAQDIMIDPFALEMSNASVREWFARCAQSISAISQVDNVSGNGISDPYNSSPFKQMIARGFGLSATDTQTLIDKQFDILGEEAGLTRLGATGSVGEVTFYTYTVPTQTTTFALGTQLATVADAETPALTFTTTGSATITPQTAASFYDPVNGWWGVTIPVQCSSTGLNTNVGAGTIRTINSGGPQGWSVVNQASTEFGTDDESNANFAYRIADALVAGFDSGTRYGYKKAAQKTPGVVNSLVVAAGDLEMLRDWDPIRQKHVFGCVDIYVEGTDTSEQDNEVFFTYANTGTFDDVGSYLSLVPPPTFTGALVFGISAFNTLTNVPYTAVQLEVQRTGATPIYMGVNTAQFDNVNGNLIVNPNEMAYQIVGNSVSEVRVPLLINGNPASNQVLMAALASAQSGSYTFSLFAREESPLTFIPPLQPILSINSITGNGPTGVIPPADTQLIHTSNFYLQGLSQNANDTVQVNSNISAPVTKAIVANSTTPVPIDSAMDLPISTTGVPGNVLSVISQNGQTKYIFGTDYTITPYGPYHQYALNVLQQTTNLTAISIGVVAANVIAVTAPITDLTLGAFVTFANISDPTISAQLNGVTVQVATLTGSAPNYTGFTANFNYAGVYGPTPNSGIYTYSNIATGQTVNVTYNKFVLAEQLQYAAGEQQTLSGTLPTQLNNLGFVHNTWLPESYVLASDNVTPGTILSLDGAVYNPDSSLNLAQSVTQGSVYEGATLLGYSTLIAAQIPHDSRYIKVTYNDGVGNIVKTEGIDFTLTVDPTSGAATLTRILTGTIPDGGVVNVSYFYTETFDVSTEYPSFVQILTTALAATKAAAASVLVKSMVANQVDLTCVVNLNASADPGTVDPNVRTAVDIAMDNAVGKLSQSAIVSAIQAVTGVQEVQLPLLKLAKSNGAYDIGIVIPTDTNWIPLTQDPIFSQFQTPQFAYITSASVLPDNTIPSGGQVDSAVGLLYQGQEYRRALSVADFLQNSSTTPSFYIIGLNDQVNATTPIPTYALRVMITEPAVATPAQRSYFVTYQVYNQGGTKDIVMSSTEYLVPGTVTITYNVAGS